MGEIYEIVRDREGNEIGVATNLGALDYRGPEAPGTHNTEEMTPVHTKLLPGVSVETVAPCNVLTVGGSDDYGQNPSSAAA